MYSHIQVFAKPAYFPQKGTDGSGQLTSNQRIVSYLCEKLPDFFYRVCEARNGQVSDGAWPTIDILPGFSGQEADLMVKVCAFDTDQDSVDVLRDALVREIAHELGQGWPLDYVQPVWTLHM